MDRASIIKLIREEIANAATDSMFSVRNIPFHDHAGVTTPKLDPQEALLGFPITQVPDATVAPTDTPAVGTFRWLVDSTPLYRLWGYWVYRNTSGTPVYAWRATGFTSSGSSLVLETNGVVNGSQSLLNLKEGTGIDITDDGVGGVTITCTVSPVTPGGVTGDIQVNIGGTFSTIDGLTLDTIGNARGFAALDLQTYRVFSTEVAKAQGAITIGNQCRGDGFGSIVMGSLSVSESTGTQTIVIGTSNSGRGVNSVVLGVSSSADSAATGGIAIGVSAVASNAYTISIGGGATTDGNYCTAIGYGSYSHGIFGGTKCLALGYAASAEGNNTWAIGTSTTNTVSNSILIGNGINLGINGTDFQDGVKVIFIADATTTPTTNPASGFILYSDAGVLKYRNSTGVVTPVGASIPTAITVANEATDTTCFVAFFTAATGDLGPKTNSNMTFNSNTGVVTLASSVLTTTDINGGTIDGTTIGATSPSSAIVTSLQADSITNDTGLAAGTYTPTRSAETNLDSNVTTTEAQYLRVGNTVTVSGRFTADPTTTLVQTSFEITLPVASNIGAAEDVAGTAVCGTISSGSECAEVIGVAANDTAKIQWVPVDVTSKTWSYTFTYQVI